MRKKDLKILIVEDDRSTAKVLAEAFKRAGLNPSTSSHPKDATKQFQAESFDLVIMDCMLPGINGVELSKKFQSLSSQKFKLILTSGIYKNPSFTREAKSRTQCDYFFNKPFDIEEFVTKAISLFDSELEDDVDPISDLVTEAEISPESITTALSQIESVQGTDLPLIYSYLSRARISGTLHLNSSKGIQSRIEFYEGKISAVTVPDRKSYFGILLIENGFTSARDIEEHLAQKSDKPIGLRLVESQTISPHSIKIILKQQMSLRLSKTIQEDSFEVSFQMADDLKKPDHMISDLELSHLCNDWIDSKLNRDYLLRFYIPWMEYKVVFQDDQSRFQSLKDLPALRIAPKIFEHFNKDRSLHELMAVSGVEDEEFLSVVHFLVMQKLIIFVKAGSRQKDLKHFHRYLKSLANGIEEKDFFQILGLNREAREREIEKAYLDLAKTVHPDKLDKSTPRELVAMTNMVFSKVNEAYEVLRNTESRQKYVKKLVNGSAETILQTESMVVKGEAFLKRGEYSKAYKVFKEVYKQRSYRADVPILLAWALLKVPTEDDKAATVQKTAQALLKKVPPEERHQPRFYLVKGLYYAFVGHHEKAATHFKNAYTADPSLIEARRELIRSQRQESSRPDLSKTLITKILKKMG